jgi:glycosyltransferase involved in cell wall biosynthesis
MMKVLILTPELRIGGTCRDAVEWANRFVAAGDDVGLIALSAEGEGVGRLRPEVHRVGLGGGRAIASSLKLLGILRQHPSAVILANAGTLAGLAILFRGLGLIRNRIVFVDPFNPADTLRHDCKTRLIYRWLLWRADAFVHLSRFAERVHLAIGLTPTKSHLIPNVSSPRHRRTSPKPLGTPLRLIAVGRLDRIKGFDRLIRALKSIVVRRPGTTLRIVGEGCDRSRLEAIICESGMAAYVTLIGHSDNVAGELRDADLFVLPSLYEGMPNTLVEALDEGLRVVATSCRGTVRSLMYQIGASEMLIDEHVFEAGLGRAIDAALGLDDIAWGEIHARHRAIFDPDLNFNKLRNLLLA